MKKRHKEELKKVKKYKSMYKKLKDENSVLAENLENCKNNKENLLQRCLSVVDDFVVFDESLMD